MLTLKSVKLQGVRALREKGEKREKRRQVNLWKARRTYQHQTTYASPMGARKCHTMCTSAVFDSMSFISLSSFQRVIYTLDFSAGCLEARCGQGGVTTSTLCTSPSQLPHSTAGSEIKWCVCVFMSMCVCLLQTYSIPMVGKTTNRAAAFLFPPQEQRVANGCHANEPDRLLWHHSIR